MLERIGDYLRVLALDRVGASDATDDQWERVAADALEQAELKWHE